MIAGIVVAAVGALLGAGGLTALLQARSLSRKNSAEAEVSLGGGWQALYLTMREDLSKVRERLAVVEAAEATCQERLARLERGRPAQTERIVKRLIDTELEARSA